jgi:maltooligosyltrehalose trehalohydrolase
LETTLGAVPLSGQKCRFEVWAPRAEQVEVRVVAPQERTILLHKEALGYHCGVAEGLGPGARYKYRLDGGAERPDPASRYQPLGVHGPSEVVGGEFNWSDKDWEGLPLKEYVLYELHVGTFTPEATFDAAAAKLDYLKSLGITAVELMPVGQFPGNRNWGYDGVYLYAVHDSYGGPQGLKRFVDACHRRGLALVLDVVYNHLGPEGNYLAEFAPYFTNRYHTPWGPAINFDGGESDEVRRYFIENALFWVTEYHVDALRLDAIHAIVDPSARPFLEDLGAAVHERARKLNRSIYLIPESDRNDCRFVASRRTGGIGLDAQWSDDFHHCVHTLVTGERQGYYEDFGRLSDFGKAYREGYVYSGQYSAHRRRRHGNSSRRLAAHQFVVFAQNHDQVGNRLLGERLTQVVSFDALKLVAGTVLLSPFIPLLFMGEEFGESAPFPYFVSHSDPGLIEAVRKGRTEEFRAFRWQGEIPDPQDEATFQRAKLHWELCSREPHRLLLEFYRELIRLRKSHRALAHLAKESMEVTDWEEPKVLMVRRWFERDEVVQVMNFRSSTLEIPFAFPIGSWVKCIDSLEARWGGPGGDAPEKFDSTGELRWTLPPYAFWAFARNGGSEE